MSESPSTLTLDANDTRVAWGLLEKHVEPFFSAWEHAAEPPEILSYLPHGPPVLRRLALVELIKIDLDFRWTRDKQPRRVEEYAAEHPDLADSRGVACDLLMEEYHIRRRTGAAVDPHEYFERFPQQRRELGQLLGTDVAVQSTSLFLRRRHKVIEVGEQLEEFDLKEALGQGAFAKVFLAWQRSLGRLVALKISDNLGLEPQTMAQLEHPNIVRIYDERLLPELGLKLLYMEYVSGGTLQDVVEQVRETPVAHRHGRLLLEVVDRNLARRGVLPPDDSAPRLDISQLNWPDAVCQLGMRLAHALDYLHAKQALHRDLKPANILLTDEAVPKLVDFNVSFCSKLDGATPAAYFGGSLAYMSPEQLEAFNPRCQDRTPDSLDGRSDLYSLGIVLWELMVGARPFSNLTLDSSWGDTLDHLTRQRRAGVNREARKHLDESCPSDMQEVLESLLEAEPNKRPATGGELASRLQLCADARRLLRPSAWKTTVRIFALVFLLLVAIAPNSLAAWACDNGNKTLGIPEQARQFYEEQRDLINNAIHTLGAGIWLVIIWPVVKTLRRVRHGRAADAEIARAGQRCLWLGHYVAILGLSLWLIAGIFYPTILQAACGGLQPLDFLRFFGVHLMCGSVAAGHAFLLVTVIAIRAIHPWLVRSYVASEQEVRHLARLSSAAWIYFGLVVSIPLLGLFWLTFARLGLASDMFWRRVLIGSVAAGLCAGFFLARLIQQDLAALSSAARGKATR